jgi:uncharacterized protein YndB with AHSA1/START domain
MSEAIRQGDIPGVQLRCRQGLDLEPEVAWPYLVEAAKLEQWLCARVVAAEGAPRRQTSWEGAFDLDSGATEIVSPVAAEPPQRLVSSLAQPGWKAATRLEFELLPRDRGCEVSVLQNGFEHLPLSQSLTVWEAYRRRWRAALGRLAGLVEVPHASSS